MKKLPELDSQKALPRLLNFIRERTAAAGKTRLVVGLSGGIDSAVAAYLGVRALGKENLTAFLLPYRTTRPDSIEDALLVSRELGIDHHRIDITPVVDAYFHLFPEADQKRRGNFMARCRMAILYDQSAALDALVLGTGNRTEALLGYTTLWGDMACAFTPLGGLYKTQVRQLAAHLGVPPRIIEKVPTADLWEGQTDEGELGISYEEADLVLYHLYDLGYPEEKVVREGFDPDVVRRVKSMVEASTYKRRMPPYCEL
ncbi:MAG: NAD+ synthase [Actinomycetota bacterium]